MAAAALLSHLMDTPEYSRNPEKVPSATGTALRLVSQRSGGSHEGADTMNATPTLDPETLKDRSRSNRKTRLGRK
jgi:hypothetical protein